MLDWITGKKIRLSLSLSPACLETLDAIADHTQLNRSEVIEQIAAGRIALASSTAKTHCKITPEGVTLDAASAQTQPPSSDATGSTHEAAQQPAAPNAASSAGAAPSHTAHRDQAHPVASTAPSPAPVPAAPAAADAAAALTQQLHQQVISLNQQLTSLQAVLQRQQQAQTTQQQEYQQLSRQTAQQQQRIEELEQQLAQAQQVATIGEARLNRWRFQTYSR